MRTNKLCSTALIIVICMLHCRSADTNTVHDIWEYIFVTNNYNNQIRPVRDWSTPTILNFSLSIIALIEFNEVKESITITGKLTLEWIDEYLTWDPALYDNISHIHVLQSQIWTPYLFLENSVSKQSEMGTPSLKLIVQHDGRVKWKPVEILHTTCSADVKKFPFDTQRCSMIFETVGYTGSELKMMSLMEHADFHEYGGTSGWTIDSTRIQTVDEDSEIHVICSIVLRRIPTYFVLNVFLPISLLTFLSNCVFILPVQSGEKASFVVTVFLSLSVFLTIVSSNLPENSKISMLNIYVFNSTLLCTIIVVVTLLEIRLFHRNPEIPVPEYLKLITQMFSSYKFTCKNRVNDASVHNEMTLSDADTVELHDKVPTDKHYAMRKMSLMTLTPGLGWPQVVKALDNIFFIIFLTINIIMTITIIALATVEDDQPADHDEHH